jgi:hypothetical protein
MSRFDDKMRYRAGNWINDHASQLAAAAVTTSDSASNRELRGLAQGASPFASALFRITTAAFETSADRDATQTFR